MARTEHCWEYSVSAADLRCGYDEALDRLVAAVEASMTPVHYGAGFASPDTPKMRYLIQNANRTKARRLAARLDAQLGVHGELIETEARNECYWQGARSRGGVLSHQHRCFGSTG